MAVITILSSERYRVVTDHGLPTCCGLTPTVLHWPRGEHMVAFCQNPECENAEKAEESSGVFAHEVDLVKKWERYRKP